MEVQEARGNRHACTEIETRQSAKTDYMSKDGRNVLWSLAPMAETDIGYHYGADISMLSQFAEEKEVYCII